MRPLPLLLLLFQLSLISGLHAQQPAVFDLNSAEITTPEIQSQLRLYRNSNPETLQRRNFITSHRASAIDFTQFKKAGRGDALQLNLFNDLSLTAKIQSRVEKNSERYTLTGSLSGTSRGHFTIAVCDDTLAGNFRLEDGRSFQIRNTTAGYHETRTINEASIPHCETTHEHEVNAPAPAKKQPEKSAKGTPALNDNGTIFDILVVYTAAAKSAVGGEAAIIARIDLGIQETNTSYENSNITPRVNLVHQEEISYTESASLGTDLSRLRNKSDGFLDSVHALRDEHYADIVSLWVDGAGCGIGYLMTNLSTGFESSAFNVCDYACATGNYTFGHEMGHNMGCTHAVGDGDPATQQGGGLFNYSHGWRDQFNRYRSVMAYSPGSRRQYFSNPNVNFSNGEPTGVATSEPNAAYNALGINNAALTVSNFRQRPAPFEISPDEPYIVEAPLGGAFTPASKTYRITNTGTQSLDWNASFELGWLNFSPQSGTINAGNFTDVSVSPNFSGTVPLIPKNSTWKYLDNGSDQGTAWRENNFDDSAWQQGQAQLGYGDGDEQTVVEFGSNSSDKHITTYFRHTFEIINGSDYSNLKIHVLRDDGVVIYLNGSEILRDNMPTGSINYNTVANATVSSDNEDTFFEFDLNGVSLIDGENVIAAEIHQRSGTSSDISFNLELQADGPFIPGIFNGTFTFENITGGESLNRNITLTVLPPIEIPTLQPEPEFTAGTQNTISWAATDQATQYHIEASTNPQFTQIISSQNITPPTTNHNFTDLLDGEKYYYRIRATEPNGQSDWSETASSTQDATPPNSAIQLPSGTMSEKEFSLLLGADDSASGVANTEIFWSRNNEPYNSLGTYPTAQTIINFDSETTGGDGNYRFYSRATDNVGNIEPAPANPDIEIIIDTSGNPDDPNIKYPAHWILY